MMRELVALGCPPFTPTEEQREQVRVLAFNGVEHDRIAAILEIRPIELTYHFRRELDLSEDVILAIAAQAVRDLARQRADLGVALRANELMLKTRSARWREPKIEAAANVRPEEMDLVQVEAAIARLERRRRDAAGAAEAEAAAPGDEAVAG
jgi:predicted metal-dependent hydrolase